MRESSREDSEIRYLPISTKTLALRSFRATDLDAFLAYRNDPDVARYQAWEEISAEAAAAYLRDQMQSSLAPPGRWRQIAIALRSGDQLIGDIGLCLRDDGYSAELGFTVAAGHQRLGVAREALTGLISALFGQTELERLDAVTDARNLPAMRLLARLGFEVKSTAPAMFKGVSCEEHTYTLSRVAWTG